MENTIILQRELEEAAYQCRRSLRKAQEALYQLNALADYPTPSTLADVTTSNLLAFVEQRIKAVEATDLYTISEKEERANNWTEWRVKTMPYVGAVESFVNDWQDVAPVLDTSDMTILTSDITESLTHRYIVEVPLQAHTHLALIEDVKKSIRALRQWEKEQDLKKIPLKELVDTSEENLLQSWASGFIKVNDAGDDSAKRWREAVYNATF